MLIGVCDHVPICLITNRAGQGLELTSDYLSPLIHQSLLPSVLAKQLRLEGFCDVLCDGERGAQEVGLSIYSHF